MHKAELRKLYLTKRAALSDAAFSKKNRGIIENFLVFFDFSKITAIHCFLPIIKQHEIDTWPVIQTLYKQHIKIIVSKSNMQDSTMQHYLFEPWTKIVENKWGIPEPVTGTLFPVAQINMILLPLLTFDKHGHRVGYGKGFYDRFLPQCAPHTLKVGFSHFPPVSKISDVQSHDVSLDFCITPKKVWVFKA